MKNNIASSFILLLALFTAGCTKKIDIEYPETSLPKPKREKSNVHLCIVFDQDARIAIQDKQGNKTDIVIDTGDVIQRLATRYFSDLYQTDTIELANVIFYHECDLMVYPKFISLEYESTNTDNNAKTVMRYRLNNKVYEQRKLRENFYIEKEFEYPCYLDGFGLRNLRKLNTRSVYELMYEIDKNIRSMGLKGLNG